MAQPTNSSDKTGIIGRNVPIAAWLPAYDKSWFRPDLIAGLTVWALLVPEAMAYAEIAGMPPETGLYAALGAFIGYAVFASSRQLTVGPSSTVAILSASTVASLAGTDNYIDLSIALALLAGAFFIVFGIARLGFISVFLSKPVLTGFTFGLGLTIAIGQANKVFGVDGGSGNFFDKLWALIQDLPDTDVRTALIGLGSLAALFVMGRLWGHKVPGALILVVVTIVLSNLLAWDAAGVHVVGDIPASLPPLGLPNLGFEDLWDLIPGALGIVLVGYAESYGAASSLGRRHDYDIDANQELIGLGAANVGSGLLGGFTVDGSLSRSSAADEAGGKSQMAYLLCAVMVLVTILALTDFFHELPEAVLGAIVIHAVWGTFRVGEMQRIWRTNRGDFYAAAAALAGVCAVNILPGLLIAVLVSFVMLVYEASRPNMPRLGRIPGVGAFVSVETYPEAEEVPGVVVMRLDAPMFFANAAAVHARITELRRSVPKPTAIVADLETVYFVDTDGTDQIREIIAELREHDIDFAIARLTMAGRRALRRAEVFDMIGEDRFFPSVRSAVAAMDASSETHPEDLPEMQDPPGPITPEGPSELHDQDGPEDQGELDDQGRPKDRGRPKDQDGPEG